MHLKGAGEKDKLNYLFVVDAVNFCFWPDKEKDRWEIKYGNKRYRGYYGLSMSLRKAWESGIPITDFRYLKNITEKELRIIFAGRGQLPLLKERARILRQCASILLRRYDGQVSELVLSAKGSALQLVYKIAGEFEPFDDRATYNGQPVWFLKRAQILTGDIWGCFKGGGIGKFYDIDKLTALADYRLPELLEYYGVLEYAPDLKKKILGKKKISAGSKEEVEIRAATIWAVEYLKQAVKKKLNSMLIDWILWNKSQRLKSLLPPHHRTRTIFY